MLLSVFIAIGEKLEKVLNSLVFELEKSTPVMKYLAQLKRF